MDIAVLLTETEHLLLTAPRKGPVQQLTDLAMQTDFHIGVMGRRTPLLAELSVAENIALPGMYHRNLSPRQICERLREPIAALGLETILDHSPARLTRDEAFKVKLLRCLGQDSGIILMPTPATDDVGRAFKAVNALGGGIRLWIAALEKTAAAYAVFDLKPIALEGTP